MITRRKFFSGVAAAAGAAAITQQPPTLAADPSGTSGEPKAFPPGQPGVDYTPVETPNGTTLPFKIIDGVKVFHLVAEEFDHEICPGLKIKAWGYNGHTPGPTIEAVEGDRVRFYVTNRLPEPTSLHWHGVLLPNGMDGVSGLTQKGISPGETMRYEFTLRQHGTQMYHPHFDEMIQMGMGMMGMFIIHPRKRPDPPIDRDFTLMLSEWRIDPGASRPDTTEMTDFNILTFNSKAFPGTAPLVVKRGQRVKIRLGNLGAMDHHPIHLHGYRFRVTETDGGQIPESAQQVATTVLTAVGSTRAVEFVADALGDWAFHCHMTHHTMNQMGHRIPNLIGIDPSTLDPKVRKILPGYMTMGTKGMGGMGEMGMKVPRNSVPMLGAEGPFSYIDMGGMFTIFKVREQLANYSDPGWYQHPTGTTSVIASPEELKRDLGLDPAPAGDLHTPSLHGHHG